MLSKITGKELAEPLNSRPWCDILDDIPKLRRGESWHAVHCITETDDHVRSWLGPKHFNFETYYPLVREMRPIPKRHQSQKERRSPFQVVKPTLVPFFPRYIFVRFDVSRMNWREAFDVAGVGGMLCHGNMPAPMADFVIAKLRSREVDGAVPGAMKVRECFSFTEGETVRITEGPFAAFNGVVDKLSPEAIGTLDPCARITVLANLFGRQTPVELEISQIAKL